MSENFTLKPNPKVDNTNKHVYQESGFLSKLRGGAELVHAVKFRRRSETDEWENVTLYMRLLTIAEEAEVREEVAMIFDDSETKSQAKQVADSISKELLIIEKTLTKACTIQEKSQATGGIEFKYLVNSHLTQLYRLYVELCAKYDPQYEKLLDDDVVDDIVQDLEKKSLSVSNLSHHELVSVANYLLSAQTLLRDNIAMLQSSSNSQTD